MKHTVKQLQDEKEKHEQKVRVKDKKTKSLRK